MTKHTLAAGFLLSFATLSAHRPALRAQTATLDSAPSPAARAEAALNRAIADGPLAVRAFLDQFPKGADLHIHLSGAIYAERLIQDAA
jgi:adenosine deaminase